MAREEKTEIELVERKVEGIMQSVEVGNSKKITLPEFVSCITKDKEVLTILEHYGIITNDDLRENFGANEDEKLPDCDSDLEDEVSKDRWELPPEHKTTLPKSHPKSATSIEEPNASIELEHIHGYKCDNVRNNVRYTRTGKLVYHAASVGIVLDMAETKQKHFLEHAGEICCLAIHPGLACAATGEVGAEPFICVWDTFTMQCLARISGVLRGGVANLAFSGDGKYLAASGADTQHTVAIYDWNAKRTAKEPHSAGLMAAAQISRSPILSLAFSPASSVLAAAGVRDLAFITFGNGVLEVTRPVSWGAGLPRTLLCGAYLGNTLVTGSFGGELLVWKECSLTAVISAHKGPVNAIWARDNRKGLITGGNDGTVILWDFSLRRELEIGIAGNKALNCLVPRIRSVCETLDGSIAIGVRSGEIIEYKQSRFSLLRSHFKRELNGLAVHPQLPEFATFGLDGVFANWDIPSKKQKQFAKIDSGGDAIEYSPDGVYLALGCVSGQVIVLTAEKFTTFASRKDRSVPISVTPQL